MSNVKSRLTVYFEDPFWVGVFERICDGTLSASKVTFGAEPKEYEVWEFILRQHHRLCFSPAVAAAVKEARKNPKRVQRDVKKQLQNVGIGTKSMQALKLQQEQNKQERKVKARMRKLEAAERLFELKQQKKTEKHKGH